MTLSELDQLDFSDPNTPNVLLDQLRELFGVELGIISEIEDDIYIIKYISCTDDFNSITIGMELDVDKTYCEVVIKDKQVRTYQHIGKDPDMSLHPVYVAFQLETYIGAPIIKDGKVVGTLNFSSPRDRNNPFSDEDIQAISKLALKLASIY